MLAFVLMLAFTMISCASTEKEKDEEPFLIAIAWTDNTSSFSRHEEFLAGRGDQVIMLTKTTSDDLEYYSDGTLSDDYKRYDFSLTEEAVDILMSTSSINIDSIIDEADLVVFSGGEDISPYIYKEDFLLDEWIYNPERDSSDLLTLRYAIDNGIPVLGLCRGMQLISAYEGGSIIRDIPAYKEERGEAGRYDHRSEDDKYTFHPIEMAEGSFLDGLEITDVASYHHQAVSMDDGFNIAATYNGIIEAFEIPEDRIFALQFHPEYFSDHKESEEWRQSLAVLDRIKEMVRK